MAIVEVRNLVKKFGDLTAVDDLTFDIEQGKITGLLGPNGAGKTTTIQMLLDLVIPTSGSVKVFGKELRSHRQEVISKMNFSSPYVQLPTNLKVWENLYTFGRLYGVKNLDQKIKELTEYFSISEFLPKLTSALSTGQLTRLNLTKALL